MDLNDDTRTNVSMTAAEERSSTGITNTNTLTVRSHTHTLTRVHTLTVMALPPGPQTLQKSSTCNVTFHKLPHPPLYSIFSPVQLDCSSPWSNSTTLSSDGYLGSMHKPSQDLKHCSINNPFMPPPKMWTLCLITIIFPKLRQFPPAKNETPIFHLIHFCLQCSR